MFQTYHLKYCLILIGILALATTLIRFGDFEALHLGQNVAHVISTSACTLTAWLIIAYFRVHQIKGIGENLKTACGIVISVTACMLLSYLFTLYLPDNMIPQDMLFQLSFQDFFKRLFGLFMLTMVCYAFYTTVHTSGMLQNTRLENEQLKQAHLRAQLLSLQQQISPHFLFNSLSTLKTITRESDTKAYVVQLSKVYRYLLSINENQVTRLSEELGFINSYLYILTQRFDDALDVRIDIPEGYKNYLIPPLALQLLIENAIKHNVVIPDQPLHIDIYIQGEGEIVVRHPYHPKKTPVEGTKLGLQNINDRFKLLFDQQITVSQTESYFTVTLPLNRHERNHH
jgi:two-component system LytT family sensor kinase